MSQAAKAKISNCGSDWQSDNAYRSETGGCVGLTEPAAYEFSVSTQVSIQMLMRILNFFAQQDVTPCWVSAETSGQTIKIRLRIQGMSQRSAGIIAEKIRSIPHVFSVDLSVFSGSALGAAPNE